MNAPRFSQFALLWGLLLTSPTCRAGTETNNPLLSFPPEAVARMEWSASPYEKILQAQNVVTNVELVRDFFAYWREAPVGGARAVAYDRGHFMIFFGTNGVPIAAIREPSFTVPYAGIPFSASVTASNTTILGDRMLPRGSFLVPTHNCTNLWNRVRVGSAPVSRPEPPR